MKRASHGACVRLGAIAMAIVVLGGTLGGCANRGVLADPPPSPRG